MTVAEAILALLDDWYSGGQKDLDEMKSQLDIIVEDTITEWVEGKKDLENADDYR